MEYSEAIPRLRSSYILLSSRQHSQSGWSRQVGGYNTSYNVAALGTSRPREIVTFCCFNCSCFGHLVIDCKSPAVRDVECFYCVAGGTLHVSAQLRKTTKGASQPIEQKIWDASHTNLALDCPRPIASYIYTNTKSPSRLYQGNIYIAIGGKLNYHDIHIYAAALGSM